MISGSFHFGRGSRQMPKTPVPGVNLRSMLICQPPVKEMYVSADCCAFGYKGEDTKADKNGHREVVITSETGLTLGDLYDMDVKIREAHRLCPLAGVGSHRKDGTVKMTICFKGRITIREDDPLLEGQRAQDERCNTMRSQGPTKRSRRGKDKSWEERALAAYVMEKHSAFYAGKAIPAPDEFIAMVDKGEAFMR